MRIQHNIMAMSAYRNYTNNVSAMKKNLEKLSSGYKINRAGDDAAGLAISEKMRAQITGLETAQKNAKDGISLVQTAEGALTEVHDMLNRMVELATQSANGTYDNTTDRAQMQKEVNQLLEEINRIADSSNFNGINLLDGTLGMNTEAFEVGDLVQASPVQAGANINLSFATAGSKDLHYTTDSVGKQKPAFSIDLSSLKLQVGASATKANIKIKIGNASITVSSVAVTAGMSAGAIVNAIASAISSKYTGTSATKAITFGSGANTIWMKASVAGGVINFTVKGVGSTATKATNASAAFSSAAAAAFNNAMVGQSVTVTASGTGIGTKALLDPSHNIINITQARASSDGKRAGISLTLDATLVADGNKLTIDGKTFVFQTKGSADTLAKPADGSVIDVSKWTTASGAVGTAAIREAIAQLSNQTTTNFQIQGGSSNKIHIDQKASSTVKYTSSAALKAVFSAQKPDTAAENAGVELKVTASKIVNGNTLNIDGKKIIFNQNGTGVAGSKVKYVKASAGMAGLKAALASYGYSVSTDANDSSTLIIRAATASAASPKILGKGLTLQIGDTSDDFNQLNVAVQDMHAESLGIKDLKINTEELAQAAIKKIKDAINTVSDVRGTLGATQNRLDHTINNLAVMTENIQDAESTIRDVDVAEEMMAYTKNNILIQSAQAMLAQANQVPQGVLQLLQ